MALSHALPLSLCHTSIWSLGTEVQQVGYGWMLWFAQCIKEDRYLMYSYGTGWIFWYLLHVDIARQFILRVFLSDCCKEMGGLERSFRPIRYRHRFLCQRILYWFCCLWSVCGFPARYREDWTANKASDPGALGISQGHRRKLYNIIILSMSPGKLHDIHQKSPISSSKNQPWHQ